MAYSANPSVKKCQGDCGLRKPSAEYVDPGPEDRVCRACREAHQPPAPIPLGDGRTAITLVGKHAHGRVTLVSDAKVPQIAAYRWRVMEQIRKDGTKVGPYAVTKIPTGKRGAHMAYMHAMISGYKRTDHWDGDGLNNTDENLRDASQSQNLANQGKGRRAVSAASRYKGVDFHRATGKWRARIKVNYVQRHLGLFATQEAAARAYDAAALAEWGEFARLNFPAA